MGLGTISGLGLGDVGGEEEGGAFVLLLSIVCRVSGLRGRPPA